MTTDTNPTNGAKDQEDADPIPPATMAKAIRAGDREMEATFCERYYRSTFNLLCTFTRDRFRAEDMTHEVLIKVLVRLRTQGIDHPERLTSFIYQTARFTFIGWYRQMQKFQWHESMDDHADDHDAETDVMGEEMTLLMKQLIEEMEVPRDREVLVRSYLCDEPKQSICESLKLTPPHFDRVISRARKRLRRLVNSQDEGIQLAFADVA